MLLILHFSIWIGLLIIVFSMLTVITFNVQGTENVEGIVLDSSEQEDKQLNAKAFTKMTRLRLLKLRNLHLSQGLNCLSNKLRYLEWDRYPFRSLPSTFQPDELVELHMRCSNMEKLWKGIKVSFFFHFSYILPIHN